MLLCDFKRVAMTVEAVAYADLSQLLPLSSNLHESETWRFVLGTLVGRSTFELLAFSTVTFLWLQMALEARSVSMPNKNYYLEACLWILVVANVVVVVTAVGEAVFLLYLSADGTTMDYESDNSSGHIEDSFQQYAVYEVQEFLEGVAWGVHAVVVMIIIALTAKQIDQNLSTFSAPRRRRVTICAKALLPMLACANCYLLRSVVLVGQVCFSLHDSQHPTTITTKQRFVWWALQAGPTWIAATMLLYSARKPDRSLARSSQSPLEASFPSASHEPLLSTPIPPPAEVFLSFRQWNQVDSHLFFSPNMLSDDDDGHDDYNDENDVVLVEQPKLDSAAGAEDYNEEV